MDEMSRNRRNSASTTKPPAIEHLRKALEDGRDWATSLLEAMALWTVPQETYRGRRYNYFVAGEAFDMLLLAERLCQAVGRPVPRQEAEELLVSGHFPSSVNQSRLRHLLGVDRYRGYLNYYYGVTVEEALQLAAELEVHKRHVSNGVQYRDDFSEEAHVKVYGAPKGELLKQFRAETGAPARRSLSLSESKEFTYWLFKYRLKVKDKARSASDTRKGLEQLQRMREASQAHSIR